MDSVPGEKQLLQTVPGARPIIWGGERDREPHKEGSKGISQHSECPGVEFHPAAPLSHFGNSFLQQVGGPLSKREIPPFGSRGLVRLETPELWSGCLSPSLLQ